MELKNGLIELGQELNVSQRKLAEDFGYEFPNNYYVSRDKGCMSLRKLKSGCDKVGAKLVIEINNKRIEL